MIFRLIQIFGLTLIILFSTFSIFLADESKNSRMKMSSSGFLQYASFFEERFFDFRMKLDIESNKRESRIVLAAIDDLSLNKIGRWPWSRTIMAKLINKLEHFGAQVIAFDVFFSEPELSCHNEESPDKILADSFRHFQESRPGRTIILPYSVFPKNYMIKNDETNELYFKEIPDQLLNFILDTKQSSDGNVLNENIVEKKVFPIEILTKANVTLGHIESEASNDGVFRYYQLVANVDSFFFPSIGLSAYEAFTGKKTTLNIDSADLNYLQTVKGKIDIGHSGETKIRWLGDLSHFEQISILKILNAKDNDKAVQNLIQNKIIFIGSTAFGAHDLRNTPVDPMFPGVGLHMNLVHMLLDGHYYVPDLKSSEVSWIFLIVSTLIIILIMFFGNAILDFVSVIGVLAGIFILDLFYFLPKGYNLNLFFCMFSVLSCYSWNTLLHFYQSTKDKKMIKGAFSRYLAPSIISDLLKNPDKLKLGGEKKIITCFFSDVRDFTSISEKLNPDQLTQCLNKYMTMMTNTLFEHQGTLDKYIGDAMVAYWGAPIEIENHAYWAVKAAIAMVEKLPAINEEFTKEGFPIFKHGIGLNTGVCSVGNMGSQQIFSYTALGDNMNLGARLESLCKFYGVQINISEYTKNAIPENLRNEFKFRIIDKVRVKGRETPVIIYEVLHPSHELFKDDETLGLHAMAFELYLERKFIAAIEIFQQLNTKYSNDLSFKRLANICQKFNINPPDENWDGTYIHYEK